MNTMHSHLLVELICMREAELHDRAARRVALVQVAEPGSTGVSPSAIWRGIARLLVRTGELPALPQSRTAPESPWSR